MRKTIGWIMLVGLVIGIISVLIVLTGLMFGWVDVMIVSGSAFGIIAWIFVSTFLIVSD